ncbi:hypothetical protein [Sphingobacterium paucimobilis]|uniref:Uncharacterized protein n=1 Tax=Sphingobacterium paucimobilis HER1398 TaxID=1346330 RepID=U2H6K8_9SPHI|nr:hypothetical protein [Sphingobacterium paucimobilis]ERJ57341.1 hypothetical protein M472_01040 [Sphingobacterium paucimobilis HER1398]
MKKQFTLTGIGVDEWITYIYAGGDHRIHEECAYIAHDFVGWISYRFQLAASQIEFVISLGELVHESYSSDIQNTLLLRGTISLDKEQEPILSDKIQNAKAQNPKVVWKEKQNAVARAMATEGKQKDKHNEQKASLRFRISYPDINVN